MPVSRRDAVVDAKSESVGVQLRHVTSRFQCIVNVVLGLAQRIVQCRSHDLHHILALCLLHGEQRCLPGDVIRSWCRAGLFAAPVLNSSPRRLAALEGSSSVPDPAQDLHKIN
jgi:hypothetical protein